ncbi:MAG: glycoside hydrolase [Ruminococcus sp.]|nr:glycoside hydrolase [Ruminococcus sp.]
MNIKNFISVMASAVICVSCLSACTDKKNQNNEDTEVNAGETQETPSEETSQPDEEFPESYPEYPVSYPEIRVRDVSETYEAEDTDFGDVLKLESPKAETADIPEEEPQEEDSVEDTSEEPTSEPKSNKPYSGKGYLTGFKDDGSQSVKFTVKAPTNQHYDFSFSISAEKAVNCTVMLNGKELDKFKTRKNGKFTLITVYGVYLDKGEAEIELIPKGNIKIDYLKFSNNTTLGKISYRTDGTPVNSNASDSAKELMEFFSENYGEYIISAQYVSDSTDKELELVNKTTGKYPVIRCSALNNKGENFDTCKEDINSAKKWHTNGGIVSLMWYWEAPSKKSSVYTEETDFKLSDAVTDIDISNMSQEDIRGLYGEGQISEQCYGLIRDMDNMAELLKELKDENIPVLWRPLHEAYGNWFWWGADGEEAYSWLWQLMYDRYTEFFGLDNLIWVWNGQSSNTLVAKNTFDIAALDIYLDPEEDFGSRYEQFIAMQKIVGADKLIAISECSRVPDVDTAFRDNTVWLFSGQWYGEYISDSKGNYSETYCPRADFARFYNSEGVLTLDEYKEMKANAPKKQKTTEPQEEETQPDEQQEIPDEYQEEQPQEDEQYLYV